MKNFLKFVQTLNEEDLNKIKQDIADKIAKQETEKGKGKQDLDKMEIEDKPNQARLEDIKTEIENYEKQKIAVNTRIDEINKKIEIFSSQAKISSDPKIVAQLNDKIKNFNIQLEDLTKEIEKFDNLISDSGQNIEKLKNLDGETR